MKNKTLIIIIIAAIAIAAIAFGLKKKSTVKAPAEEPAQAEQAAEEAEAFDPNPSNKLFSIEIPEEYAGLVEYEISDTSISVYDKEQKDGGFGGFAFAIDAYDGPSSYGYTNDRKAGELTAGDGKLYDIVITHPSDVQYDFTQSPDGVPEQFAKLYDSAEAAAATVKSADGGSFVPGAGMKGEDLYPDIVEKHALALAEKWSGSRLEAEEMSPIYFALDVMGQDDLADAIGYAYADLNDDGIDELLIGEITDDSSQGMVFDVYAMVDRVPAHILSGWYRNRFHVLENGDFCNGYSGGANEIGTRIYALAHNESEITPYISFKIDSNENEEQPWFVAYGQNENDDEWENVTEEEFNEIKSRFETLKEITYIPLSTIELPEEEPAEAAAEETAEEAAEEAAEEPVEEVEEPAEAAEETAEAAEEAVEETAEAAEEVTEAVEAEAAGTANP